jgi:hypothetical protein
MTFLAALILFQAPYLTRPEQFATHARSAIGSGVQANVASLFQNPDDTAYLFQMASRRGGLRGIKFSMIPAPPGWEDTAPYWAVFHTRHDIEEDHDPVYPVLRTTNGFRLGKEMPEWAGIETRISHVQADVRLFPAENRAWIKAAATLDGKGTTRAPILRLQDLYRVKGALEAGEEMVKPSEGDIVRAGSLLIPWTAKPNKTLTFEYSGAVNSQNEDKINAKQVYLTAWWLPTIGRLPYTTSVRVVGPKSWVLKSEGPEVDPQSFGPMNPLGSDEQVKAFKCDVPISYPKVIGGAYSLAAEAVANGRTFRSYQLEPVDKELGRREVKSIADAVAFFDKTLGTFPFDHYYCFDAVGYYGIESYSHTLLAKGITLRFIPHEIGHTYFGGMAPSTYVRDTWNEGMTQYIDSIVYQNNADRSLEAGMRTLDLDLPLTKMGIAHANDSATYYRGAYVMRMLEDEIGRDKVLQGLRLMLKDRVGKDTSWPDLMQYFEDVTDQKLDWFWGQWISNSKFPTLTVQDAEPIQIENKYRTRVTVTQSGTPKPFQLRYKVIVRRGPQTVEKLVVTKAPGETFTLESGFMPTAVEVVAFPYTLARVVKLQRTRN